MAAVDKFHTHSGLGSIVPSLCSFISLSLLLSQHHQNCISIYRFKCPRHKDLRKLAGRSHIHRCLDSRIARTDTLWALRRSCTRQDPRCGYRLSVLVGRRHTSTSTRPSAIILRPCPGIRKLAHTSTHNWLRPSTHQLHMLQHCPRYTCTCTRKHQSIP